MCSYNDFVNENNELRIMENVLMNLYRREDYLQKVRGFYHDTSLIKVIAGVRRCGKSCLMETIALELKEAGVHEENIIYLNLDKRGYRHIKTADQLDALIAEKSTAEGIKYLLNNSIINFSLMDSIIYIIMSLMAVSILEASGLLKHILRKTLLILLSITNI